MVFDLMYLFGVNVIICILLEIVILLLKSRINKNREIENTHELEMKGMLSDVSVNYKEGSFFSYNYYTKELTKKRLQITQIIFSSLMNIATRFIMK